ncbi:hypothetical protein GQ457_06G008730 [Hibiscus cannabinus]
MEGESNCSFIGSSTFDGDNYPIWAVRIDTYMEAVDLWVAMKDDYEIPLLPTNPTVSQIKAQEEKKARKAKARLFVTTSSTIFTRIMSLKSAKEIWDHLKTECEGDEKIRGMQVLNLVRDFEL